jgi:thymidylate kinase
MNPILSDQSYADLPSGMGRFVTCLFNEWNTAGIRYLILRNYEDLPDSTGNDIDILLEEGALSAAEKLLRKSALEQGWALHNVGSFACRALYVYNRQTLQQIHFDLMPQIKWHTFPFIDSKLLLLRRREYKNFYIPHPAHEAAVSMMTRLIYCGHVKEVYRSFVASVAGAYAGEMERVFAKSFGSLCAAKLVRLAVAEDWDTIGGMRGTLRRALIVRLMGRSPFRMIVGIGRSVLRYASRWLRSPGLCIVFFGPDGCGKTSVAQRLNEGLETTFAKGKGLHLHWKPSLIKKSSPESENWIRNPNPHANPTRGIAGSVIYFLFHLAEYLVGWWLIIKPVLFTNGLVMIDRYYYDFMVDQRRYRLNLPAWVIRAGFRLVKKPDIVFCLDADPEILQARKKEVSFEECTRQRNAYRALAAELPNGHIIDAAQPLNDEVREVQFVVMRYLEERTSKRR